jgi:hypothetical protein
MKHFSLAAAFLITAATTVLLIGCVGGGAAAVSQPAVVFPSHEELDRLPARAPAPEAFAADAVVVDTWTFESVPEPDATAYDDTSPWGDLLREQVKAHSQTVALSPSLLCTARELARFAAKKQAAPAESLRRFMAARCGVVTSALMPFVSTSSVSPTIPDQELASEFRKQIAQVFDQHLNERHFLVGLAAARDGMNASIALAIAEDDVRLEPGSRAIDGKHEVTLRGGVRGDFVEIGGLVNRGDAGAAHCASEDGVRPPQFSVHCELDASDAFAWVEIVGRKKDGYLLHEIASTIVYAGDGHQIAYAVRHLGPPAPAATAKDLSAQLLERLNGARRAAKLAPLTLAVKQSAQNARLAGTLVDAMVSKDDGSAEQAALGLLAGWDVDGGLIRNGNFFVSVVAPEHDASAWLDFALELPLGRTALLDPDARQIAVGPAIPEGVTGVGAAVTTYSFFQSDDHAADEERFFDRLKEARIAAGVPAPVRVTGLETMRSECAQVMRGDKPPMDALQELMNTVAARTGRPVHGYVFETSDPTRVAVPPQLLAAGPMEVIVGVTHHKARGAAWGQYVVFAILLGGTPQMTASSEGARRRL